jgi:F-type H+-transporting ATPase subunit delta
MLSVVASRYAKALVDVLAAPGRPESDFASALEQLRAIQGVITGSVDLRNALLSPAVSPARKRAVMAKLLEPLRLSRPVRNFLFIVIDHRRVAEFPTIVEAFEALLDARLGYIRGNVASAQPLADEQQAKLETEISRVAGKKAILRFSTDSALVAGVVARIGSTVYDGSVRGQLDRLRVMLAKA